MFGNIGLVSVVSLLFKTVVVYVREQILGIFGDQAATVSAVIVVADS